MRSLPALAVTLALTLGCSTAPPDVLSASGRVQTADGQTAGQIDAILRRHGVATAAVGMLRGGELAFEHYFGEEAPGVPADASTRFDVASITKTVAAETFLRMVATGKADLDEPLDRYWVDPDVASDPRHHQLTARMILSHRSGFPNWRFFRSDRKLAFERDPGVAYGYSGEGFQYLWRAMERKTGQSFPQLVHQYLFNPLGIASTSLIANRSDRAHTALGVDESGNRYDPGCRPGFCWLEGDWSAAGGMVITLRNYAKIMRAISSAEGYPAALVAQRDQIVTDLGTEAVIDCDLAPAKCPKVQGYGLGFVEVDLGDARTIGHEGGDWSQLTIAYSYLPSKDGIVVFLNVPMERGVGAMRELITLLDPSSPYVARFEQWENKIAAAER